MSPTETGSDTNSREGRVIDRRKAEPENEGLRP